MPVRSILLVSSLALLAAGAVRAEGLELSVRHGKDDSRFDDTAIALRLAPLWAKKWGDWQFALHPEFELNHIRATDSQPGARSLNEGAAVALLRFHRGDGRLGPYAEVGLGGALLSRTDLGGKGFSTHFQFTEQVGLGLEVPGGWFGGWRYSHYSNANIERPNAGLDLHQILIGVRF